MLAACGDAPRAPARAPADAFTDTGPSLVWQGVVACADCAGIDTRLRLQQGVGPATRYQLVEAYLDEAGNEYFREEGRWERQGAILLLRAQAGGVRRYRIDAGGALVPVDRKGLDAGDGRVLAPVPGAESSPGM